MKNKKKSREIVEKTSNLHPRNKNIERYDLEAMCKSNPELQNFIQPNKHGENSIDFADPNAVKILNKSLLQHYYGINFWEFPDENLCPPIPGRADYLHYVADLLKENNFGRMPNKGKVVALDIGTGASCIYPIIGVSEYDWRFIATDVDEKSIDSAQSIVDENPQLKDKIELRCQKNKNNIFEGIVYKTDKIDVTICNPPFHATLEDAERGNQRKTNNLSGKQSAKTKLNFSGNANELIYEGGEIQFIENMIAESVAFSENVKWFTTLVSKQSNLKKIYQLLDQIKAQQIRTIEMGTGNKSSRIVAWKF